MPDHVCQAGTQKIGGTYWVIVRRRPRKEVQYQNYQCRKPGCSVSITMRTGNTREE
jgi:hypothetical protein